MKFQLINISLVDGCNLRCRWCDRPDGFKFLELDNLNKIVDKINQEVDYAPLLQVIGAGEVFLHPNLIEAIKVIARISVSNLRVEIWTNGTLIKYDQLKEILQLNIVDGIVFSFDGYGDKETFEYIRVGAMYSKVINNINLACSIRDEIKSKCKIAISTILPNQGDIPFNKPDDIIIKQNYEKMFPNADNIMFRPIHRYNGTFYIEGMPAGRTGIIGPCEAVEAKQLIIDAEGNVHPCCHDINHAINLGHILQNSIKDIFESQVFTTIKNTLRNGKGHHICSLCDRCKYDSVDKMISIWIEKANELYESNLVLQASNYEKQYHIDEKQRYIDQQRACIEEDQKYIQKQQEYINEQQKYIDKQQESMKNNKNRIL